jgi:hypothetical protein
LTNAKYGSRHAKANLDRTWEQVMKAWREDRERDKRVREAMLRAGQQRRKDPS